MREPSSSSDSVASSGSPVLPWHLRLVAAIELRDGSGQLHRLPSRAATLLLARLALAPARQHPREELIELLWPGAELDVGRNRLRQALAVLRSVLEPHALPADTVLKADRRAVWLVPGTLTSDVHDPQRDRTDLLPGHFDEWVLEARTERPQLRASGPAPSAPAELPLYLTRGIGLDGPAQNLADALIGHRLVVLRGPGGAGKTRLAVEVARRPGIQAAFDRVQFAALAACLTRTDMLEALLRLLCPGSATPAALDAQLRLVEQALTGRRVLLVLDNFEQLVEAGRADLLSWLARLGGLHLLVTTRRSLGVEGAVEQVLEALPVPPEGADADQLRSSPALALFADRAQAAQPGLVLGAQNLRAAADVVRAVQGLPLAIELAAARVRSLGLKELASLIAADPLPLLARSGPRGADDPRHASMQQVLVWSWRQLSAPEQRVLRGLASCSGGATLPLLAALADATPTQAALLADALMAASVVRRSEDSASGVSRWQVYEPMREFALAESGSALFIGHLHAVLRWATALPADPPPAVLQTEWANVARAIVTAANALDDAGARVAGIQLVLLLREPLEELNLPASARAAFGSLIDDAAPEAPTLHGLLAYQCFDAGEPGPARMHAEAARDAARSSPDAGGAAAALPLRLAARVLLRLGHDMAEVQALIEEALALALKHQQPRLRASLLSLQAVVMARRDRDYLRLEALHREALALWRRHGPPSRVAAGMANLSLALGYLKRVPEQLRLLDEARPIAESLGQARLLAFLTSITGYALADLKRHDEAAQMYRRCIETAWAEASWREWFYALLNLPRTLAHQRRPEAAARLIGFADDFYAERFGTIGPEDQREMRRTRRLVQVQLGREATEAEWRAGGLMTMADAQALALAETERAASRP